MSKKRGEISIKSNPINNEKIRKGIISFKNTVKVICRRLLKKYFQIKKRLAPEIEKQRKRIFNIVSVIMDKFSNTVVPEIEKQYKRIADKVFAILDKASKTISPVKSKIYAFTKPVLDKITVILDSLSEKNEKIASVVEIIRGREFKRCTKAVFYQSAALFLIIGFFSYSIGYSVYYNGVRIGSVSSQQQFKKELNAFAEEVLADTGEQIPTDLEAKLRLSLISNDEVNNPEAIRERMLNAFPQYKELNVLEINGKITAAYDDAKTISKILSEIKDSKATGDPTEVLEFADEVKITNKICNTSYYKKPDELKTFLQAPVQTATTHTVQEGETLCAIAPKYGMSVGQITQLNAGIDPTLLQIGDVLTVAHEVQTLSVKSTRTVEFVQPVAFEVQKIEDATMYKTQKKVKQEGIEGSEQITAKVVTVDGAEVARNVMTVNRVTDPVPQIVVVGTKTPPSTAPTGKLRNPASGRITSPYGYRGREFHTGVDIAKAYGAKIYAADGGTVTFAGYNGGYGYCIVISHGKGLSTLYAHCSKMYVSKGQGVSKGQHIAAMGSTGRSTGNHLHFEVRVNGVAKNPTKYVSGLGR